MAKTSWKLTDTVQPVDMNDIGQEINQLRSDLDNIDVPPASLTQAGIVQLSNAIDGTGENVAATEKAVKTVNDSLAAYSADVTLRLAGKQPTIKLENNYKGPDEGIASYPEGVSLFYVGAGTGGQGTAWRTSAGATEGFGYVETVRSGGGGYQVYTEMYSGTDVTNKVNNKQYKRNKRDSNSFWQPFEKIIDQDDLDEHKADYTLQVPYGGTTTGVANNYVVNTPTIPSLIVGMAISVKINVASTGPSTLNWDGKGAKGLKKVDGTNITNLIANGIYTFRYDGINFIVQGEGGEYGTATTPDVLTGKTIGTESGLVAGTMVNNGAGGTITPSTVKQTKSAGYYSSDITVVGDPNLMSANIKQGIDIFGVLGTSPQGSSKGASGISYTDTFIQNKVHNSRILVDGLNFFPKHFFIEVLGPKVIWASFAPPPTKTYYTDVELIDPISRMYISSVGGYQGGFQFNVYVSYIYSNFQGSYTVNWWAWD